MLKKSGFISQEQKEQILNSIDIVHLISDYVLLKPSGKNFIGLCPFHQEKTPSFTVSPSYQNYKCYGCGESGDSIRFIMAIENLQFIEAVGLLADKAGIKINLSQNNKTFVSAKTDIDRCLENTFVYYRNNLDQASKNSQIKQYLIKRQISEDLAKSFELGYAPTGWNNLNLHLIEDSFSTEIQEKTGLIKKGEKGGYYDRLRERLIFPIRDKRSRLLGFAGRSVGNEEPKYLNPPETELYKKSTVLYGIDKAINHIRRRRRAILVEGYLDVIRLHEHGWQETVATCGTAVTKEHILNLKSNGAEEVILLFDGDTAGIKAAERSARLFIENDLDSKVVVLPEGLDPDDYFKSNSNQEFNALVENAAYDFEFIITNTKQEFSSKGFEFQENLIKEVISLSRNIQSTIKKDLFFAKAAEFFQVDKKKLQQLLDQPETKKEKSNEQQAHFAFHRFEKEHLPEVRFLQYLMTHVQAIAIARNTVSMKDFISDDLSQIYARFLQLNNEEFMLLKAKEFPDIFVEFSTLLMHLLHYDSEYKGPNEIRPGSAEMMKLKAENDQLNNEGILKSQSFTEATLHFLISRLKKNKESYERRRLKFFRPDQIKASIQELIETRKKERLDKIKKCST